jgi:PIN domain nuclease of toxin-antitoxin system
MEVLLDTHALIWFINGDNQLPDKSIKLNCLSLSVKLRIINFA